MKSFQLRWHSIIQYVAEFSQLIISDLKTALGVSRSQGSDNKWRNYIS